MVQIELQRGDILQSEGDVVVSSIHRSKDMRVYGISNHLLKACGRDVQDKLNEVTEDNLHHGKVVETTAGKLRGFKRIMFICLYEYQSENEEALKFALVDCMNQASKSGLTSIVIPCLGMGGLKYPPSAVAIAMIQAVSIFTDNNPEASLSKVVITFHQQELELTEEFLKICEASMMESRESSVDSEVDDDTQVSITNITGMRTADESLQSPPLRGAQANSGRRSMARSNSMPLDRKRPGSSQTPPMKKAPASSWNFWQLFSPLTRLLRYSTMFGPLVFSIRPTTSSQTGVGIQINVSFDSSFIPQNLNSYLNRLSNQ